MNIINPMGEGIAAPLANNPDAEGYVAIETPRCFNPFSFLSAFLSAIAQKISSLWNRAIPQQILNEEAEGVPARPRRALNLRAYHAIIRR